MLLTDKQADRQTNATENIIYLSEIINPDHLTSEFYVYEKYAFFQES